MVAAHSVRTVFAVWMVGPSAMGSVKGIPSSMRSASVSLSIFDILIEQLLVLLTSATGLHSKHDIRRLLRGRISCGHISDEGRLDDCQFESHTPIMW